MGVLLGAATPISAYGGSVRAVGSAMLRSETPNVAARLVRTELSNAANRGVNGLRSPASNILGEGDISRLTREFQEIGGNPSMLRFNQGGRTSYVDHLNIINVRGDVMPAAYGNSARSTMSSRAVLAHEFQGHAAKRGTSLAPGSWNDEFRASYRAARYSPGLTAVERSDLMRDAISRAQEAGISITPNRYMRSILYGY